MNNSHLTTSESVAEGHPDKVADRISDAVLDAYLAVDPAARVACEALVKTGLVVLAGEVTSQAAVDLEPVVRETVRQLGYEGAELGFDWQSCAVVNAIGRQSPDIALGVDTGPGHEQGAGDQGTMVGYACDETDVLMPAAITYAHRLVRRQAEVRKSGAVPWLRPDAKSQVTVRYEDGRPTGIAAVVLSTQHTPEVGEAALKEAVMDEIIAPTLPREWLSAETAVFINPTGRFVVGGPRGDCGVTGRKIMVDSYGACGAHHGGGCFSGKDPSKVDRSAAYMARYIAKNLVAAGLARRCEVQLAYAIGIAEPVSVSVETFGTAAVDEGRLLERVRAHFPLHPRDMVEALDLLRPIYAQTAAYGHFGREEPGFTWEATDKAEALRDA